MDNKFLSIPILKWKILLKYTSSYLKYTSSILQPVELQKKKHTSSLSYFDKKSTFEAHFVKLNQSFKGKLAVHFQYTLSILEVYFLEEYCKYTLSILPLYFRSILQVYFTKNHGPFLGFICLSGPLYGDD